MNATTLLLVGAVGGLGALSRFLVDGAVSARAGVDLPVGTLAVNLSGAFLLGLLSATLASGTTRTVLGIGFVGAYTTFSTWMLETHRSAEEGRGRVAVLNLALSLVLGLAVAWLGLKLGGAIA